jgi:dipeptidase E
MELLLISNSTSDGGYLVHVSEVISEFARGIDTAAFIPYAGVTRTWDEYEDRVAQALAPVGISIRSVHRADDPADAVRQARMVMVGGGNTFNLLHHCRRTGVLDAVAERVRAGLPYLGWSAGANLACPTIRTTNDMPVIDPGGFDALDLIDFQINPHFVSGKLPGHFGESREERLAEFLTVNPAIGVLALPEGGWLLVSGDNMVLGGVRPALWLRHGQPVQNLTAGPLRMEFCDGVQAGARSL